MPFTPYRLMTDQQAGAALEEFLAERPAALKRLRAERSARSRHLREQLKTHGWDQDPIRQLVHDVDPAHPALF